MPKCQACGKDVAYVFKFEKYMVCGECLRMMEIIQGVNEKREGCKDGQCFRGNS
jgi:hypothetical protein